MTTEEEEMRRMVQEFEHGVGDGNKRSRTDDFDSIGFLKAVWWFFVFSAVVFLIMGLIGSGRPKSESQKEAEKQQMLERFVNGELSN